MTTKTMMMLLAMMTATAPADALADNTCPPAAPAKPKLKKRNHKKVPPKKPLVVPTCTCQGEPGPQGPRGPQGYAGVPGEKGRDGTVTVVHQDGTKFPVDVGVFATAMVGSGAWAWGPAFQVGGKVTEHYDATLMLGLALGVGDHQDGYQLRLGVQRQFRTDTKTRAYLTAGLNLLDINAGQGNPSADHVLLDVGIVLAHKVGPVDLKTNILPLLIGGFQSSERTDTRFDIGMSGSLNASVRW